MGKQATATETKKKQQPEPTKQRRVVVVIKKKPAKMRTVTLERVPGVIVQFKVPVKS